MTLKNVVVWDWRTKKLSKKTLKPSTVNYYLLKNPKEYKQ